MFQSFHFHFLLATYFLCFVQVDETPSIRPDLFDRQQCSELGGFNAPGCAFQKNHHQESENIPASSCHCFGTSFQGKSLNSSTYTDSILTFTQFSRHIGWHGNFIGNFLLFQPEPYQYSVTLVLIKLLSLHQQTGKSAKTRSTKMTADAPQSSQAKRKGPKSTKSQAKRHRIATPPPPPRSPIPIESSPSCPGAQTQQVLTPPQPQEEPQPEGTSADVHEQTADPVGSIIASVVSSIQTSIALPQGNVLSMKLLPMNLPFHLIITPVNFQLTLFHRQLQPINP